MTVLTLKERIESRPKPVESSRIETALVTVFAWTGVAIYVLFWILSSLFGLAIMVFVVGLLYHFATHGYLAATALIVLVGLLLYLGCRE